MKRVRFYGVFTPTEYWTRGNDKNLYVVSVDRLRVESGKRRVRR